MKRDKDWEKFEDFIAEELKQIDPHVKHTKGSRYGDLKCKGLHIECKSYANKNTYREEWMKKCMSEVPLHSDKLPLLVTKNAMNDIRVHMNWFDFKELYFEYYKLKYGG